MADIHDLTNEALPLDNIRALLVRDSFTRDGPKAANSELLRFYDTHENPMLALYSLGLTAVEGDSGEFAAESFGHGAMLAHKLIRKARRGVSADKSLPHLQAADAEHLAHLAADRFDLTSWENDFTGRADEDIADEDILSVPQHLLDAYYPQLVAEKSVQTHVLDHNKENASKIHLDAVAAFAGAAVITAALRTATLRALPQ